MTAVFGAGHSSAVGAGPNIGIRSESGILSRSSLHFKRTVTVYFSRDLSILLK